MTEGILEQFHREMALLGVPCWSYTVDLEEFGSTRITTLRAQVACMKGGHPACTDIHLAIPWELYAGPKGYAVRRAAEQLVRHIEKETA